VVHCPLDLFVGQKVTPGCDWHGSGAQPPPGVGKVAVSLMSPTHQRLFDGPPRLTLARTTVRIPMLKISPHSKCAPLIGMFGCACQVAVPPPVSIPPATPLCDTGCSADQADKFRPRAVLRIMPELSTYRACRPEGVRVMEPVSPLNQPGCTAFQRSRSLLSQWTDAPSAKTYHVSPTLIGPDGSYLSTTQSSARNRVSERV
jgi:hypothetical protein